MMKLNKQQKIILKRNKTLKVKSVNLIKNKQKDFNIRDDIFDIEPRADVIARVVRWHARRQQTSNLPLSEPVVWGWWEVGFRGSEVGGCCWASRSARNVARVVRGHAGPAKPPTLPQISNPPRQSSNPLSPRSCGVGGLEVCADPFVVPRM